MTRPKNIRIIINADDFGRSETINDAIVRCLEEGAISSATIMANGLDWQAACRATAQFPRASFGVHLNLTDYRPISNGAGLARYWGRMVSSTDDSAMRANSATPCMLLTSGVHRFSE